MSLDPKTKRARILLIITSVVFAIVGALGILPAITSVFMFDAPGSTGNPTTIVVFVCALTLPVTCAASIIVSWILYAVARLKTACTIAFLPLVNLVVGGGALICLEVFNGGRFSG